MNSTYERFGQMIMLGLDVSDLNNEIIELIKTYKIGGVVLYKKNYSSEDSMKLFAYIKYPNKNFPEGRHQFSISIYKNKLVILSPPHPLLITSYFIHHFPY